MQFLHFASALAAFPLLTTARPQPRASSDYPIVSTANGKVQGVASGYRDGITVYKGLPYAASTAGQNRWKPPQPAESWSDVLHADTFGPVCTQQVGSSAGIFNVATNTSSEDCLSLNVWTPTYNSTSDLQTKNLPVYVWIYGGRFTSGSGNVKTYDGSGLASKDIIVVTLNYRLGVFGFLAHPELSAESGHNSSGNYGLLDQIAALKWVKNNIREFGGNPDQITVGGQSAGSASSLAMMWSPLSRDMVSGVISESGARGPHDPDTAGAATSYRTKAAAEANGVSALKKVNASSIAELRSVSVDTLSSLSQSSDTLFEGTQFANLSSAFMEAPEYRPVIDGYVLTHTYGEALRTNDHGDVPILTGNNKDESGASPSTSVNMTQYKTDFTEMFGNFSERFFSLYPATNATQATDSYNTFFRDMSRVGTWRWAVDWAAGGAKSNVYTYYWTHTPPEDSTSGAYHGSELWYVFNNIPYAQYSNVTWTDTDYAIESKMAAYWANFIKTGDPNGGDLATFEPTTEKDLKTMWLGNEFEFGQIAATEERVKFIEDWESTLKEW